MLSLFSSPQAKSPQYKGQLLSDAAHLGLFLVIVGGIPGTLVGGAMADRWVNRFLGARVVIPGVCIVISGPVWTLGWPEWWNWWRNLPIWG